MVSLIRPFIRRFQAIDGLSVLPILSFGLLATTLPAFGFRPELVPLSLFALIMAFASIPRLVELAQGLRADDYGERRPIGSVILFFVLLGCLAIAVIYKPQQDGSSIDREPLAYEIMGHGGNSTLSLRVFRPDDTVISPPYPVVVFAPSVFGSAKSFDDYLGALADHGIIAVSFSRHGFDVPSETSRNHVILPSTRNFADAVKALFWGTRWAFGVDAAKRLEAIRIVDIKATTVEVFSRILASNTDDPYYSGADPERIVIGGVGIGGAAALSISGSGQTGQISAAVAIEAPLLGYQRLSVPAAPTDTASLFSKGSVAIDALRTTCGLWPVNGVGEVPRASLPTLIFVSDEIQEIEERDSRYATLIRFLRLSASSCAIVSCPGVGSLDFSDAPRETPIYSLFVSASSRIPPEKTRAVSSAAQRAAALTRAFIDGGLGLVSSDPSITIESN